MIIQQSARQASNGFATMKPFPSQATAATSPWQVFDPNGNSIQSICAGTTTQCLNEFIAASFKNGWQGRVACAGSIPYTGSAVSPTWKPSQQQIISATSPIVFPVGQDVTFEIRNCLVNVTVTSQVGWTFDSCGSCSLYLDIVYVYNVASANSSSYAVGIIPSTNTNDGFAGFYGGTLFMRAPVANVLSGTMSGAVLGINTGSGSTTQQNINITEINCNNQAAYGVEVFGASGTTGLLQTTINIQQVHGCVTTAVAEGISSTNAANYNNNIWTINNIESNGGSSRGIDTWGTRDLWIVGRVDNSQGGLQYGFVTETTGSNNTFYNNQVSGASTSNKLDTGSNNAWIGPDVGSTCTGPRTVVSGIIASCTTPAFLATVKPADPTGSTSATGVMMGLGSNCTITPASSGKVTFYIQGQVANAGGTNNNTLQLRYGTGAAPANGAALTGTTLGNQVIMTSPAANFAMDGVFSGTVSGLTLSTAVWFDVSLAASASTSTYKSVSCHASEQ